MSPKSVRSPQTMAATLRAHRLAFQACHERALEGGGAEGSVVARFVIEGSGRVTHVCVESTYGLQAEDLSCTLDAIRSMRFGAAEAKVVVIIPIYYQTYRAPLTYDPW